jgi:hypothetical protein
MGRRICAFIVLYFSLLHAEYALRVLHNVQVGLQELIALPRVVASCKLGRIQTSMKIIPAINEYIS